jgi:diadenosine tetraphosphate (Ap4A) HIT family hydrolase
MVSALALERTPSLERFAWVSDGRRAGPDRVFDADLANMDAAAVVPTKGAIIPEWLMVIPRVRAISVAAIEGDRRKAVLDCAQRVRNVVGNVAGDAVMFEHGSAQVGSAAGCGVDQAHIHVVGLSEAFVSAMLRDDSAGLEWRSVANSDPWEHIPNATEYLLLSHGERSWIAQTHAPLSQFMRRRIADFVGTPGEWDYRRHPHAANAERSKHLFRFEAAT